MASECGWQAGDGLCAAVLHEVFRWLDAHALCAASACCRAWRSAAAAPALWRHLLARRAALSPARMRTLAANHVVWREEYVRSFAGWREVQEVQGVQGAQGAQGGRRAPALAGARHAALAADGRLALVSEDAELAIWELLEDGTWDQRWSTSLRTRGWASAERAQWAEAGARLLLVGALALADSWELLVLQLDEEGAGRVVSRARCSAGAAGCWADAAGEAFLSLELRLLAPRVACTTVWLNAATQETQSEHAGVTSPLLRMYNEGGAHFTLAAVAEAPTEPGDASRAHRVRDEADDDVEYLALRSEDRPPAAAPLLVTGSGTRGAGALSAWWLRARRPEPVRAHAAGDLVARRARAAAAPPAARDPPAPTESEVRALCSEPSARLALPAPPAGLAPHSSGRCAWVPLSGGGAWCVSLPALRVLRRVRGEGESPDALLLHYVQPAVSDLYIAR